MLFRSWRLHHPPEVVFYAPPDPNYPPRCAKYVPPGFASCTRSEDHEGPCAHPRKEADLWPGDEPDAGNTSPHVTGTSCGPDDDEDYVGPV